MPELIMERPKMSLQMHETLKRYILRERRKKKEEDVAIEQKIREEMKKAEMTTQSLEQTKGQLKQLETKLEELQLKKRDLFNQLKRVLHEETNLKKQTTPNPPIVPMYPMAQPTGLHPNHMPQLINQTHNFGSLAHQPPPSILAPPGPGSMPTGHMLNQQPTSKPQSPFHPTLLPPPQQAPPGSPAHHLMGLKYLPPMSPQLMANQSPGPLLIPPPPPPPPLGPPQSSTIMNRSPSNSPHLLTSSPRNQPQQQQQQQQQMLNPNQIKRQRSPSPPVSPALLSHQQLLMNHQAQLHPTSRSPATASHMIPSSPPPNLIGAPQSFNSPSSNKKVRPPPQANQSPQMMRNSSSQQQQQQQQQQSMMSQQPPVNPSQSSQSAFSSYLNQRGGFQPMPAKSGNMNMQHQGPPHQTTPISPHLSRNMPQPPPHSPSHSVLSAIPIGTSSQFPPPPHQFSQHHYLNSLTPEAQKILFQQQQSLQQQSPHFSQYAMISAAAAAVAAANAHQQQQQQQQQSQPQQQPPPPSAATGGSILTGFPIRSSNSSSNMPHPSAHHPPY